MVNAVLFYRTDTTLTDSVATLLGGTAQQKSQCLEYDAPENILEAISETYGNRINEQVSVNSEGERQIFIRDDGMASRTIKIQGVIKKEETDIPKLKKFRILPQTTEKLVHGRFGLRIGNADFFQIDPKEDTTSPVTVGRGLMIKDMSIGYDGSRKVRYGFSVTLAFGGKHIDDESGNV